MFRLFTIILVSILISCDNRDFEVIGIRDNETQFAATVYTPDTNWTKMERFAKELIDGRRNKLSEDCVVGFYSNKDKTPRFSSAGKPIINSKDDVTGHLKYLIAVYDIQDGFEKIKTTK